MLPPAAGKARAVVADQGEGIVIPQGHKDGQGGESEWGMGVWTRRQRDRGFLRSGPFRRASRERLRSPALVSSRSPAMRFTSSTLEAKEPAPAPENGRRTQPCFCRALCFHAPVEDARVVVTPSDLPILPTRLSTVVLKR